MRTLYLRNVPDEVVERLERLARGERMSLNAFPVRELSRSWMPRDVSAYDACYVALAEGLDCPPLTAARRLARGRSPLRRAAAGRLTT